MSAPKSVVKFKKDGVEFVSSVDRANYTIRELTRAALIDVGKFISRKCVYRAKAELTGFAHNKSKRISTYFKKSAFSYWVRKRETDLIVGIRHDTWYGVAQELGTLVSGGQGSGIKGVPGGSGAYGRKRKIRKHGILRNTTYDNIPTIIEIESKYLSAIEDDLKAQQLIREDVETEDD